MSTSRPLDPEKRGRLEPYRMSSTEKKLRDLGCKVSPGPDGFKSFTVIFPSGRRFNFWPYSGWFAGKASGRGFDRLLQAGGLQNSPSAAPCTELVAEPSDGAAKSPEGETKQT